MRIISQDGLVDLPYNSSLITAFEGDEEWVIQAINMNRVFFIGTYKSKDEAMNEIERILLKFSENWKVYRMSRPKSTKKAQN